MGAQYIRLKIKSYWEKGLTEEDKNKSAPEASNVLFPLLYFKRRRRLLSLRLELNDSVCLCQQVLANQQSPHQAPDHRSPHVHAGHAVLWGDPSLRFLALPAGPAGKTSQVPLLWYSEVRVHIQLESSHHAPRVQDSERIAQTGGAPAPHRDLWHGEGPTDRATWQIIPALKLEPLPLVRSFSFCTF